MHSWGPLGEILRIMGPLFRGLGFNVFADKKVYKTTHVSYRLNS